jgi:transcriptional regulator with XRE-family HTH domain
MPPISRLIRRARLAAKLTQAELGEKAGGVSRQHINNLERGRKPDPQLSTLKKIAKACGLTVSEMLQGLRGMYI